MSKTSQLSQRFRHAIEQGHLRPGDRMPSLRKLCLDHKVSITTAQRAYAELEKQGLIESLPRSGFRVLGLSSLSLRQAPPLPDHPGEFRAEHLTMALPMPWAPFMNPVLINTTPLTRALTRALSDYRYALSSTDSEGYEGLRRELALRYLAQGVELDGEEMLITCGGMEALNLAIRAVARLSGSDCMLVITPAFPPIFEQLEQLALRPVGFNCPPGQPLDLERLEALLIQHQPAAIIAMPNFQHPTGQVMSDSQKPRCWRWRNATACPSSRTTPTASCTSAKARHCRSRLSISAAACCTAPRSANRWRRATASAGSPPGASATA